MHPCALSLSFSLQQTNLAPRPVPKLAPPLLDLCDTTLVAEVTIRIQDEDKQLPKCSWILNEVYEANHPLEVVPEGWIQRPPCFCINVTKICMVAVHSSLVLPFPNQNNGHWQLFNNPGERQPPRCGTLSTSPNDLSEVQASTRSDCPFELVDSKNSVHVLSGRLVRTMKARMYPLKMWWHY